MIDAASLISGVVVGAMYALVGVGLVVEYRASRVVNLAHGGQALLAAFVFYALRRDVPTAVAFAIALAAAVLSGYLLERVAIDLLRNATALNQVVVTLGVLLVLQSGADILFGDNTQSSTIFGGTVRLAGVNVSGDQIAVVIGAAVAVFGLQAFLRVTPTGLLMRAAADRPEMGELAGVDTRHMSRVAWMLGGFLAGLAGILVTPLLLLDPLTFALLIVQAYAALLIGRMESIPLAFIGGISLGVGQSIVAFNVDRIGSRELFALAVALVALLARSGQLAWSTDEEVA